MVTVSESEREGFDDVLGSGGIFRKVLTVNTDGIQAGSKSLCSDGMSSSVSIVPLQKNICHMGHGFLTTVVVVCID